MVFSAMYHLVLRCASPLMDFFFVSFRWVNDVETRDRCGFTGFRGNFLGLLFGLTWIPIQLTLIKRTNCKLLNDIPYMVSGICMFLFALACPEG
jgi:hypothetical protein